MKRWIKSSGHYKLNFFLGILLVVVSYVSIFNNLSSEAFNFYFNSDALYTTAIYHDLFVNEAGLRGWQISPSPYFFPDMPVYFAIYALSGNIPLSFFIYGVFQISLIILIFYLIIKTLAKDNHHTFFLVFLFSMTFIFLPGIYGGEYIFSFFVFSHSYHLSAFTMALLSFYFLILFLKHNKLWPLIWVVIISALSIASDKLFIITFALPTAFVIIILFLVNRKQRKLFYKALIAVIGGLTLGIFLFYFIKNNSVFDIPEVKLHLTSDSFLTSMQGLAGVLSYWFKNPLTATSLIITISTFTLSVVGFIRNKEVKIKAFSLFSAIYIFIVLLAPVFTGQFTDLVAARYNISSVYMGVLSIWIFLFFVKISFKKAQIIFTVLFAASITILCINPGLKNIQKGFQKFIDFYPTESMVIDTLSSDYDVESGIANYWTARRATLFSKKSIEVLPVFFDFTKIRETNNKRAYSYPENKKFNFVISNNLTDEKSIIKTYGNAVKTLNYHGYKIYLTPEFYYKKNDRLPYLK